ARAGSWRRRSRVTTARSIRAASRRPVALTLQTGRGYARMVRHGPDPRTPRRSPGGSAADDPTPGRGTVAWGASPVTARHHAAGCRPVACPPAHPGHEVL